MSVEIGECEQPRRYRVLALDGGGVKGAYTASVLHTLEKLTGKTVGQHFDLITGTSTGGIIAVAIGLGIPLQNVVDLYVEQGPVIFPEQPSGRWKRMKLTWQNLWRPKHSQRILLDAVSSVFGERKLGESWNRLVIPAFNAQSGDIYLFKTSHHPDLRMDCLLPATTVAMATSAAPTYLSAYKDPAGRVFIDGGVWANCPVVVGLVEAIACLGWPREQIDVLSIGTTSEPFHVGEEKHNGGLVQWGKGIIDIFQEAQGRGMLGMAKALTAGRMTRIDIVSRPGRFALDGSKEVQNLKALEENSARQYLQEVERVFFQLLRKCLYRTNGADIAVKSRLIGRRNSKSRQTSLKDSQQKTALCFTARRNGSGSLILLFPAAEEHACYCTKFGSGSEHISGRAFSKSASRAAFSSASFLASIASCCRRCSACAS